MIQVLKLIQKNPAETTYSLLYDSLCWISKDSGIAIEGASEVCFDQSLKAPKGDPKYEALKKIPFFKNVPKLRRPFQKLRKKLYGHF